MVKNRLKITKSYFFQSKITRYPKAILKNSFWTFRHALLAAQLTVEISRFSPQLSLLQSVKVTKFAKIFFNVFWKFNFEAFFLKILLLEPTLVFGMRYWDVNPHQNMFCKLAKVFCRPSNRHRRGGRRKSSFFFQGLFWST